MAKLAPHADNKLNALRLLAFGAVGFYLYQSFKKEGKLSSALGETKISVDSDKLVDSLVPWMGLSGIHQEMVREGLKKFAENYKGAKK